MTLQAFQISLQSRFNALFFILGKILRFGLVLLFIIIIGSQTRLIAGYDIWQLVFFFATFNLIDVMVQFFLRQVYFFRPLIINGRFDYLLLSPISPLFRSLLGRADILDAPILGLAIVLLIFSGLKIGQIELISMLSFMALVLNAFLIALSFHILVLSLGVVTTVVDNALWLYRDLSQMARIPVDIYREPLRAFLTFVIPIGIMITFPAKALMGLLSPAFIIFSFVIGILSISLSLIIWREALKRYSSASS